MTEPASRPLRTYGRRRGHRLSPARSALFDTLLPALRLPPAEPLGGPLDPAGLFATPKRSFWLEIGFGGGEHLAAQAQAHPDVGFIGCEVYEDGVGSLLSQVDRLGLGNVRLHDDARTVLDRLSDACLERVYVLFPDPWPKARHHKRRLISPPVLGALARVLADGGLLIFASDHVDYVRWTLERLTVHGDFRWLAKGPADWDRPGDWVETRYEAKALAAGRRCFYFLFERLPRSAVV
jgi:tRNA (guanine-N7-)-methyltransferase